MEFATIGNVKGKTLIIRVDINSSIQDGNLKVSGRIKEHSKTLKEFSDKGAKLVVLAHQGRPGDDDFFSLEQHARAMGELTKKYIKLVKWDQDYISEIKKMKNGDIILMDNVRQLEDEMKEVSIEEHGKAEFVRKLAAAGDAFVQDGMSVTHRAQASVVGFKNYLKCYAGRVVLMETSAFDRGKNIRGKRVLVLGGAKVKDSLKMIKHMLGANLTDEVLCGGLFGELFLKSQGVEFGKKEEFFRSKEEFISNIENAKKVFEEFPRKILFAVDFGVDKDNKREEISVEELPSEYLTKDIGKITADKFEGELKSAELVIWNGPMGVYEEKGFEVGTKKVAEAIASGSAYSVIGGGDTETAIAAVGLDKGRFSYVSLSGKASLEYLAGKELPGLAILEKK